MKFATVTTEEYERTASGKSWKSKPTHVETAEISEEQYHNMTSDDTCRFFRRLGGAETVTRCYTRKGYLPVEIVSTNPGKTVRKIRKFEI